MVIKILGGGCPNCHKLEKHAKIAVEELGMTAEFVKVTDMKDITGYGVMSTPALVVDEKVVSYGKVISVKDIKKLLS